MSVEEVEHDTGSNGENNSDKQNVYIQVTVLAIIIVARSHSLHGKRQGHEQWQTTC